MFHEHMMKDGNGGFKPIIIQHMADSHLVRAFRFLFIKNHSLQNEQYKKAKAIVEALSSIPTVLMTGVQRKNLSTASAAVEKFEKEIESGESHKRMLAKINTFAATAFIAEGLRRDNTREEFQKMLAEILPELSSRAAIEIPKFEPILYIGSEYDEDDEDEDKEYYDDDEDEDDEDLPY